MQAFGRIRRECLASVCALSQGPPGGPQPTHSGPRQVRCDSYRAENDPLSLKYLSKLIGDADEHLTGRRRPEDTQYARDAEAALIGDVAIVHLSDGGYSRLMLTVSVLPYMWFDLGAATSEVAERWRKLGL